MTIISRYIFRQTAGTLILILLSLAGVVWIALALKQLNVVTSQGSDVWTLLALTTLALPNLIALIAPVAFLIACIHVLNRLNNDSELIVLSASGSTVGRIARPMLVIALFVSLGVAFVNHAAMPWTLRKLRTTVLDMRTNLIGQVLQPGRFTAAEGGKIVFHIRERSPDGELAGILMHDTRDPKQTLSYLAERGVVVQRQNETFLYMEKGHVLRRSDKEPAPEILQFESYAVDLDGFEKKAGALTWRPRELYTHELLAVSRSAGRVPRPAADAAKGDDKPVRSKSAKGQIYAELHERLASPLYPFVFALVTLAFLGRSQSTRTSRVKATVACFLVAATARLGGMALNNIVVARPALFLLLYALPVAVMMAATIAILMADRPWARSTRGRGAARRIENAVDAAGRALASQSGRTRAVRATGWGS